MMSKRRLRAQSRLERFFLLTSLWPFCYSTVILLGHIYLIYQGAVRYTVYSQYLVPYSNFLLGVVCLVAILVPAIILSSFVRVGSYTNDAVQGKLFPYMI